MLKHRLMLMAIAAVLAIPTVLVAQIRYADSVIAFSTQYSPGNWSAQQILGPPNTFPNYGDIATSWAFSGTESGREFIELHFPSPAPVSMIAVYETDGPGAIDTVYVKNPGTGGWEVVWSGTAGPVPYPQSRIFSVKFPLTSYAVSEVRLAMNGAAFPGWKEYDAVGISTAGPMDLPDLTVSAVVTPPDAWSEQTIDVSWTVRNIGSASPDVTTWTDRIFLMPTPAYDYASNVLEEGQTNMSTLAPGESYTAHRSITIPRGLNGNYYLFVVTDDHGTVMDSSRVDNMGLNHVPIVVHLTPKPDLRVSSVTVPRTVFAGDTVSVSFTVKNTGVVSTTEGVSWDDVVLFSPDSELVNLGDATTLAQISRDSILAPDSSYRRFASVVIPGNAYGANYIYVKTDRWDQIFENNSELNNILRSDSMTVIGVPADLVVDSISVPATANSGTHFPVAWKIRNAGVGATFEPEWTDALYLATQPVFDRDSAVFIGTFPHAGVLAADSSYLDSETPVLPNGISGAWYVYVVTDVYGVVSERDRKDNNIRRSYSPINVSLSPWPDLVVPSISVPATGKAGEPFTISWSVTNQGAGAAPEIVWKDRVLISHDSVYTDGALEIGAFPHGGGLVPGATYTQHGEVTIPPSYSGRVYFYVWTNFEDIVYESTDNTNNIMRSVPVAVEAYPVIDLSAGVPVLPDTCAAGSVVSLRWSVHNNGAGKTYTGGWYDGIYLTDSPVYDPDSVRFLGEFWHDGDLKPGEQYSRTEDVAIPREVSGTMYLMLVTDPQEGIGDTLRLNNTTVKRVTIVVTPPADLMVDAVLIPDTIILGQPTMIHYTVKNAGVGAAVAGEWYDAVFLARTADPGSPLYRLETVRHSGPLEAGLSYTDSVEIVLPGSALGNRYIVIRTNTRDDVFESDRDNNARTAAIVGAKSAPCDLMVSDVMVSDSAEPGQMMTVIYTLKNLGPNPVSGRVTDIVYLTPGLVRSESDPVLGIVTHDIDLAPGGSAVTKARVRCLAGTLNDYTETLGGELPGVLPGQYHATVRTDVFEAFNDTNVINNSFASGAVVHVTIPPLQRNVVLATKIHQNESRYFSFAASEGEDLQLTVADLTPTNQMEVFVRVGAMPTRGSYDFLYPAQGSAVQKMTIPSTTAGTYYVLVRGSLVGQDSSDLTLMVKTLQFGIDSIMYSTAGNGGEVTIRILGAKFRPGARAQLRRSGMPPVDQNVDLPVHSTQFNARFTTAGLAAGSYDVAVINPDLQEAVLPNGLTIEEGKIPRLNVTFVGPASVRIGRPATFYVVATNTSNVNVERAVIKLAVNPAMKCYVDLDGGLFDTRPLTAEGDTTIDGNGDAAVPIFAYNVAPLRARWIRMILIPTMKGRFILSAETSVFDRATFDSVLVESAVAGSNQGWLQIPPVDTGLYRAPMPKFSPAHTFRILGCQNAPGDEANTCEIMRDHTRMGDVANDGGDVYKSAIEASAVFDMKEKKKLFSFFWELLKWYDRWKNSSGYAADGIVSQDPNDITGPAGSGDERWVSVNQTLPYTLRFENDSLKATAPAQTVSITVDLDTTVNPASFRLMSFGFRGMDFTGADRRSFYSQRLDLRDSLGIFVDVTAGVDVENHRAIWNFRSIDPSTGDTPADPSVGFLPVNNSIHQGEGYVNYSIRPRSTSKTRDRISPKGVIVFDANEPLATPPIHNTIDAGYPSSRVRVLTAADSLVRLQWTGADDSTGSGIRDVAIYVSSNDSAFRVWQGNIVDTEAIFHGTTGNRYRFFSVATDIAGNSETVKSAAEDSAIITGIGDRKNAVPLCFALAQNYPNPFNPVTTVRYQIPAESRVSLKIYSILGQVVATLVDEIQKAGYRTVNWNASNVASGVYFYRMEAVSMSGAGKAFTSVKKMIVLK